MKGATNKSNRNGSYENVLETIPVAEIDLSMPLKVVGQKRSDKYLNMQPDKKKSKKKSKKKKHKTVSSSDDEENDGDGVGGASLVVVNQNFELPEGAKMSDESDSGQMNPDDPHRALDIDLEL